MKKKIKLWIPATMLAISSLFLVTNCTKDDDVTTEKTIPVLTTNEVLGINQTTATSGGLITSDGGDTVIARGVCWSTNQSPTITDSKTTDGAGLGSFTSAITGLTANTTYYVRAYATNSSGTGYGSNMSFTTLEENSTTNGNIVFNPNITYGTMTDIDGNTYKTVAIKNQTWMAENLKVTKYNDGTTIPNVTDATAWYELTTGALCDYKNTPSNSETYGKLYNWYAVNTGKLCPTGWHVPTEEEFMNLFEILDVSIVAGEFKETGKTHWKESSNLYTNKTGFTALPGGFRFDTGSFQYIGDYGYWWSAAESRLATSAVNFNISSSYSPVNINSSNKRLGASVRCVKD